MLKPFLTCPAFSMQTLCRVEIPTILLVMIWSTQTATTLSELRNEWTATSSIINTHSGLVQGNKKTLNGRTYEEFLGIPYAVPPVGNLRWKKPQPVESWKNVLSATSYKQHCTQFIAKLYPLIGLKGGSGEDCLYLNIWVPRCAAADASKLRLLPVMVWVYGGGLVLGNGEMYPGNELAVRGDVVVVNFNYRVSTLGWLSTGNDVLPGNYGLWDLHAVLVWVQKNIVAFTGDPNRVTIFGQSSGGVLVSHAVVSPKIQGLFRGAIAISGASTAVWGLDPSPQRATSLLAKTLGCGPFDSMAKTVECLAKIDPHLLDFWGIVCQIVIGKSISSFGPVIDGDLISLPPKESFRRGYGQHVNFITGSAYHDAAGFVIVNPIALPFLDDKLNFAVTRKRMLETLNLMFAGAAVPGELIEKTFEQYPSLNTSDEVTRTLVLTEILTDWIFGSASNWEAVQHASSAKGRVSTYQYQFHYRQSFLVGYPKWIEGSHLDDIYSIFGDPFMKTYRELYLRADFNEVDLEVSRHLTNYYCNFAYTGNPNKGPYTVPVEWLALNSSIQNYLREASDFSMQTFDDDVIANYRFWIDLEFNGTESDTSEYSIADGIARLRHQMRHFLSNDNELCVAVDKLINELAASLKGMAAFS